MKRLGVLSVVLSIAAVPVSHAQSGGIKGMDMKDMDMKGMKSDNKARDQVHKGTGTVQKVDPAKGTVTLAHGPIKSLNWPSMTMTYGVKDKALLDKAQSGAKVEFSFVQSGKDYMITEMKK